MSTLVNYSPYHRSGDESSQMPILATMFGSNWPEVAELGKSEWPSWF